MTIAPLTIAGLGFLTSPVWLRVAVTVVIVLSAVLAGLMIGRAVMRRTEEVEARYRGRKAVIYLSALAALIALLIVWLPHLGQLGWALGLLGAGVALALAGPIACIAGWLHVVVRRPFDVGDRVQIGAVTGDVINIEAMHTTLMEVGGWVDADQSTGRMVLVPNQRVFTEPVFNYTKGFPFIWDELTITLTFESDWRRARELMRERANEGAAKIEPVVRPMLNQVAQRYELRFGQLTPIVYTRIADSGVELTLRHLVQVRQRRGTAAALAEAVLDDIAAEPTVTLAYPTQRITGIGAAPPAPGAPTPAGEQAT